MRNLLNLVIVGLGYIISTMDITCKINVLTRRFVDRDKVVDIVSKPVHVSAVVAVTKEDLLNLGVAVDAVAVVHVQLLYSTTELVFHLDSPGLEYRVQVGTHDDNRRFWCTSLDVLEPRFKAPHSSFSILNVPHQDVERPLGQEALVGGIVLFLSPKIPRHESDLVFVARGILPISEVDPYCCQGNVVVAHLDLLEANGSTFLCEVEEERRLPLVALTDDH